MGQARGGNVRLLYFWLYFLGPSKGDREGYGEMCDSHIFAVFSCAKQRGIGREGGVVSPPSLRTLIHFAFLVF